MPLPESRPSKVVLYQYDACFESARVRRLLRQMDVRFTPETLAPGDKSVIKFKFHKSSVPVLQDGPFVSDDLAEILTHIERTYGKRAPGVTAPTGAKNGVSKPPARAASKPVAGKPVAGKPVAAKPVSAKPAQAKAVSAKRGAAKAPARKAAGRAPLARKGKA